EGTHVAILSHALWTRRFGADPNIVGKTTIISGERVQIIGVMPPLSMQIGLWYPLDYKVSDMQTRTNHFLMVYGRLKPGVTNQRAQQDMDRIALEIQNETPQRNQEHGAHLQPLHEKMVGEIQSSLVVLAVAVGFVLLIACANV